MQSLNVNSSLGASKVIVYGIDTQVGLALIRELGRAGYLVVGIAKSPGGIGLFSNCLWRRYVQPVCSETEKVAFLNQVAAETGAYNLICVSETDILFFHRVRERLENIKPLIPDLDPFLKVLSKSQTASIAQKVGIEVPRTWQLCTSDELEIYQEEFSYPLVLKWSNPHDVMDLAREAGVNIEKVDYCYSFEELRQKMQQFEVLKKFPMLQEFCRGYGLGQFFFMHEGRAVLRFQHRRIHEWPPEGGFSSLCESLPISEYSALQERSIALLKGLNWRGVAMVEYRYDPQTGRAVLMEINGRFWGSLPLAYYSGMPFAQATVQIFGEGLEPEETKIIYRELLCRNVLVELKRLIRIVFQPDKIRNKELKFNSLIETLSFMAGFFRINMRYYVFDWKDQKPFWRDIYNMVKRLSLLGHKKIFTSTRVQTND